MIAEPRDGVFDSEHRAAVGVFGRAGAIGYGGNDNTALEDDIAMRVLAGNSCLEMACSGNRSSKQAPAGIHAALRGDRGSERYWSERALIAGLGAGDFFLTLRQPDKELVEFQAVELQRARRDLCEHIHVGVA